MTKWQDKREKLPQKEDEDAQGCVLVWHEYSGAMVYKAENIMKNTFITHWMKLPKRPERCADEEIRE